MNYRPKNIGIEIIVSLFAALITLLKKLFKMKRLLLLLSLPIALKSTSQIQAVHEVPKDVVLGEVKVVGSLHSRLSYQVYDSDTIYTLLYLNAKYKVLTEYETIHFNNEGGTLDTLYSILKTFFSNEHKKEKDYKVMFKLGDEQVMANSYRTMGATVVTIFTKNGHCEFYEKWIDRLFGKFKSNNK